MQESSTDIDAQNDDTAPQLTAIQLRVLGALMEKELTTPDQYPLTLNALISACNQKSSRDPVTSYQQGEVARALLELQDRHFVRREHGSRTERYTQRFVNQLALGRKHQSLLCVMMLRGPQTLSELSTRTQRMGTFTDMADIEHTVHRLCERETPYAVRLAPSPGQRGDRVAHRFGDLPPATSSTVASSSTHQEAPATTAQDHAADSLQSQVNTLKRETAQLREQLATLYRLTGHQIGEDSPATDDVDANDH